MGKSANTPTYRVRIYRTSVQKCFEIPHFFQHKWKTCNLPSMTPPSSRSTTRRVSFPKGLKFSLLCRSPLTIIEVCIVLWYPHQWLSGGKLLFRPPPYRPSLCNLYHLVWGILLRFFVFSLDGIHQTLHYGKQFICTMLFHHSLVLCIFRVTWKQSPCLITLVIEWMESWCSCDLNFESNLPIHCNLPAHTFFVLYRWNSSKISKLHTQ